MVVNGMIKDAIEQDKSKKNPITMIIDLGICGDLIEILKKNQINLESMIELIKFKVIQKCGIDNDDLYKNCLRKLSLDDTLIPSDDPIDIISCKQVIKVLPLTEEKIRDVVIIEPMKEEKLANTKSAKPAKPLGKKAAKKKLKKSDETSVNESQTSDIIISAEKSKEVDTISETTDGLDHKYCDTEEDTNTGTNTNTNTDTGFVPVVDKNSVKKAKRLAKRTAEKTEENQDSSDDEKLLSNSNKATVKSSTGSTGSTKSKSMSWSDLSEDLRPIENLDSQKPTQTTRHVTIAQRFAKSPQSEWRISPAAQKKLAVQQSSFTPMFFEDNIFSCRPISDSEKIVPRLNDQHSIKEIIRQQTMDVVVYFELCEQLRHAFEKGLISPDASEEEIHKHATRIVKTLIVPHMKYKTHYAVDQFHVVKDFNSMGTYVYKPKYPVVLPNFSEWSYEQKQIERYGWIHVGYLSFRQFNSEYGHSIDENNRIVHYKGDNQAKMRIDHYTSLIFEYSKDKWNVYMLDNFDTNVLVPPSCLEYIKQTENN